MKWLNPRSMTVTVPPAPRRGEVWWVRLDPTLGSEIGKTRPCLVIGTNIVNQRRRTVIVVPLSSSPAAGPPLLVPVASAGQTSMVVIDQIRAVAKQRFHRLIGTLSLEDLAAVEDALRQILELA
jgi:mRNA interferase MazF